MSGGEAYFQSGSEQGGQGLVEKQVDALLNAGIVDNTLTTDTSDHDGIGTGHGGESIDEVEILWIASGPGIVAGSRIDDPIDTYDTAPTVLHALCIRPPESWIGRPVTPDYTHG